MVVDVGPDRGLERLDQASLRLDVKDDLRSYLDREIFPLIDMGRWADLLIGGLKEGEVTSFSSIARALGDPRASRAVGTLISEGALKGPVHRIVYSDGTIPKKSITELKDERCLRRSGGGASLPDGVSIREFSLDHPPFRSLRRVQEVMGALVRKEDKMPVSIAGADISTGGPLSVACISRSDLDGGSKMHVFRQGRLPMPYVSGYLFYREGPLMMSAVEEARAKGIIDDDTLLVLDGNGILHPRRSGIACQVGAAVDMMTCGVAKKLMMGKIGPEERSVGPLSVSDLKDGDELIGYAVRSKGRPVYLSRGHRTTLKGVLDSLAPTWKHRVPLPTRCSHILCNRKRRLSEAPSGDL